MIQIKLGFTFTTNFLLIRMAEIILKRWTRSFEHGIIGLFSWRSYSFRRTIFTLHTWCYWFFVQFLRSNSMCMEGCSQELPVTHLKLIQWMKGKSAGYNWRMLFCSNKKKCNNAHKTTFSSFNFLLRFHTHTDAGHCKRNTSFILRMKRISYG